MEPLVAVDWVVTLGVTPGFDVAFVAEQPVMVRAIAGFLVVLAFSGALRYWKTGLVDDAVASLFTHPVSAIGFGVVTHLVVAFGFVYVSSQLAGMELFGVDASAVGVIAGVITLLTIGAFGFLVVGGTIVELWGARPGVNAVVIGAFLAGAAASADPTVAVLVWVGIVSVGIGGAMHDWFNASALDDHAG